MKLYEVEYFTRDGLRNEWIEARDVLHAEKKIKSRNKHVFVSIKSVRRVS